MITTVYRPFLYGWRDLVEHQHNVRIAGEKVFRNALGDQIECSQKKLPSTEGPASPQDRDIVSAKVQQYMRRRQIAFRPFGESISLVLAHALFERLAFDLLAEAVGITDLTTLIEAFPDTRVPVMRATKELESVVRECVSQTHEEKSLKLDKAVGKLVSLCSTASKSECTVLCRLYKHDLSRIEDIDKKRQAIIHRIELDQDADFESERSFIKQEARFLVHLFANCILTMNIEHLSPDCVGYVQSELRTIDQPSKRGEINSGVLGEEWQTNELARAAWRSCLID